MKILAKEIVPTREDIRKRFNKRLGSISALYSPLTSLYAEETERLIMELWQRNQDIPESEHPFIYVNRISRRSDTRHYCSNCQTQNIYPKHNYCPCCGIAIRWTD
jgi:uncharacterized paraquat-inducible protein A